MDKVMAALKAYDNSPEALNKRLGAFEKLEAKKKQAQLDANQLASLRRQQNLELWKEKQQIAQKAKKIEHWKQRFNMGLPRVTVKSHEVAEAANNSLGFALHKVSSQSSLLSNIMSWFVHYAHATPGLFLASHRLGTRTQPTDLASSPNPAKFWPKWA